ncbi:hypothetical protein GMA19_04187 [Paenibacillus polymyxa E681]|nr:hypothetical protein PPE_04175 [Paenibacillus polymyxa E681]QNV58982.1 hypothetical protein GE561_04189 [Paenibacillus polymyxa E681]QNV63817.1 hypothetical protein GMA19_04187 [Paenibacillus polymyxa E681]
MKLINGKRNVCFEIFLALVFSLVIAYLSFAIVITCINLFVNRFQAGYFFLKLDQPLFFFLKLTRHMFKYIFDLAESSQVHF